MMSSYIASFLGFQGQKNSTDEGNPEVSFISCAGYGWTTPDPAVRLRVNSATWKGNKVRIFGYPPQEDFTESMQYPPGDMAYPPAPQIGVSGPYMHYLYDPGPSVTKYVMGDDWRSQLRSDYPPPGRATAYDGDVVLRPTVSGESSDACRSTVLMANEDPAAQAEERAHSLRMRRCGAVAVFSHGDMGDYELGWIYAGPKHVYAFGWPRDGGVWVLRSPRMDDRPRPRLSDWGVMEWNMREAKEDRAFEVLAERLKREEDMEDVCRVLEEVGARYYANISDCPEAVQMNFC